MEPKVTEGFKLPKLKGIEGITPEEPAKTLGLSADLDTEKFIEEEFYPGVSKNTIYSDLGPAELYTKNAVAQKITRDRNIKHYFSPDNIGKTVDELADEQETLETDNRFMRQLDFVFANGLDIDDLDDAFFQKEVEELNALSLAKPERPPKPPLEMPSEIMLGLGGVFELFASPGQQFRALSVPFGYMIAKNSREMQESDQLYQERLRDWGARLGLKEKQVQMIADRQVKEMEIKQKNFADMIKTRYGMVKDQNELQLAYDKMKHDTNLAVFKADADSVLKMKEEAFGLMSAGKAPELRALGAAMLGSLTGFEIPVQMSYTPDELKTLAEQAGIGLDNALKTATFGSKVATAQSEAQQKAIEVAFLPEQLRAGLQQTLSVTNLNSVSAAVKVGQLNLDWQKFEFEKANGAGGAKDLGTILKGAFEGLDTTYNVVSKNQASVKEKMDARRREVLKDVSFENAGPLGIFGKETKERNEQRIEELLAADDEYQGLKRQYDSFTNDLNQIGLRKEVARQMTPSSIRAGFVNNIEKQLAKAKTATAYQDTVRSILKQSSDMKAELRELEVKGKLTDTKRRQIEAKYGFKDVTPLEVIKAIQNKPPVGMDGLALQRQILSGFANMALKDPGTAEQYVDAILREMGGVTGEVGLGSGPFQYNVGVEGGIPKSLQKPSTKAPSIQDKKQLARYLGGMAQAEGLPPELPIIVGLVETGSLRNLPHLGSRNDHDSVGLFQQRATWGSYEERTDIPTATRKFLNNAKRSWDKTTLYWQEGGPTKKGGTVRTIRLSKPIGELINEAKAKGNDKEYVRLLGILAQDIQRSAYGERYGQRISEARQLIGK
jgi:hypothetical protein